VLMDALAASALRVMAARLRTDGELPARRHNAR
jgi:hypothetical protein